VVPFDAPDQRGSDAARISGCGWVLAMLRLFKDGARKKRKNSHVFFKMSFLGVAGRVAVAGWQCGVPLDAPDQRGSDGARISGWGCVLAMLRLFKDGARKKEKKLSCIL
jgi:hypothetical protein